MRLLGVGDLDDDSAVADHADHAPAVDRQDRTLNSDGRRSTRFLFSIARNGRIRSQVMPSMTISINSAARRRKGGISMIEERPAKRPRAGSQ